MKGVSAAAEQSLSVTELPNMSVQRVPCLSVRQICTLCDFASCTLVKGLCVSGIIMHAVLVAQDNYVWLLHESGMGKTAVVDPSEAAPVIKALDDRYIVYLPCT